MNFQTSENVIVVINLNVIRRSVTTRFTCEKFDAPAKLQFSANLGHFFSAQNCCSAKLILI